MFRSAKSLLVRQNDQKCSKLISWLISRIFEASQIFASKLHKNWLECKQKASFIVRKKQNIEKWFSMHIFDNIMENLRLIKFIKCFSFGKFLNIVLNVLFVSHFEGKTKSSRSIILIHIATWLFKRIRYRKNMDLSLNKINRFQIDKNRLFDWMVWCIIYNISNNQKSNFIYIPSKWCIVFYRFLIKT